MSDSKFGTAFFKGIKVSEKKQNQRKEIFSLISLMSKDVQEASENRIRVEIIKDIDYIEDDDNQFFGVVAAIARTTRRPPPSYVDTIKSLNKNDIKPDHLNYVLVTKNDKNKIKLTDFTLDPAGYPCRFKVDGNILISNDRYSLESNLTKLLSSAFAGDCFRRLLDDN